MRVERIGDCTLYNGDCLTVMRQLPNVGAVVTDPPYGIGADRAAKAAAEQRKAAEAKPRGQRTKAGRGWADYGTQIGMTSAHVPRLSKRFGKSLRSR